MKHFTESKQATGLPWFFKWIGFAVAAFTIYLGFLLKPGGHQADLIVVWINEPLIFLALYFISYAREKNNVDELRGFWRYKAMWPAITIGILYLVIASVIMRFQHLSFLQMPSTEAVIVTLLTYYIIIYFQKKKFS